jgi:hypothetical protein
VLGTPRLRSQTLRRHHHLERRFHGRYRGMARPHWRGGRGRRVGYRYGRPVYASSGAAATRPAGAYTVPGVARAGAALNATGQPGIRSGPVAGGQCTCSACPTCGNPTAAQPTATTTAATPPAPAYCRCCGQVIR